MTNLATATPLHSEPITNPTTSHPSLPHGLSTRFISPQLLHARLLGSASTAPGTGAADDQSATPAPAPDAHRQKRDTRQPSLRERPQPVRPQPRSKKSS